MTVVGFDCMCGRVFLLNSNWISNIVGLISVNNRPNGSFPRSRAQETNVVVSDRGTESVLGFRFLSPRQIKSLHP